MLDDSDPLAARIGAVNTVVVRGAGRVYGTVRITWAFCGAWRAA